MSAHYPPINTIVHNKKQEQQNIKQKCYKILQSNHSTLWQNFIISILNHIDYSYNKAINSNSNININKKQKINVQQQWLQQEIELILKWISNPSNRIKQIQYSMYVHKMEKEKKEWFVALERLLDQQSVLRERFEGEVQELRNRVKEAQEFSEALKVKNSVQQQIILALKNIGQKKQIRKNNIHLIEKQRMRVKNEVNIQIRSMKDKSKEEFPKMQEKCTMTMQILSKLVETSQDPYLSKLIHNSSVFDIHLQPKLKRLSLQKIPDTSCVSPKQSTTKTMYNNNKICQTIYQATAPSSSQLPVNKAEFQKSRNLIKNRQTQCTEHDEQSELEQNQSSSSQQSSYVLQVDHGTQTCNLQMRQMQLQTDSSFLDYQATMGSLLRKISLLEIDVFNQNRQILGKQQQIGFFENKVQCLNRQISELKADIQINQQIQEHIQSSYEKQKSQNLELTQKYNQILSTLSTYLTIKPTLIQKQSQTDPNETQTLTLTPQKQQIYDDQLLTNQSEEEQYQLMKNKDIISEVDKETIIKQLLKYMEMEIQDVAFQKKASVFVTILMVLGIEGKEEDVLAKYLEKVGGLNKKKRDCGLEDKLYHYFTDDV